MINLDPKRCIGNVPTENKDGDRNVLVGVYHPDIKGAIKDARRNETCLHTASIAVNVAEVLPVLATRDGKIDPVQAVALLEALRDTAAGNREMRVLWSRKAKSPEAASTKAFAAPQFSTTATLKAPAKASAAPGKRAKGTKIATVSAT